jgi:hypothetical protein
MISEKAKAHRDKLAAYDMHESSYKSGFDSGYEFARKEMEAFLNKLEKMTVATANFDAMLDIPLHIRYEIIKYKNQPQPEGE